MQKYSLEKVMSNFKALGVFEDGYAYGEGHINDTFLIKMRRDDGAIEKYILQRINTNVFNNVKELMSNIKRVSDWLRKSVMENGGDPNRECLTVIDTIQDKPYYSADNGDKYRLYLFIDNATAYQTITNPTDFYQSAVAFGKFQKLLQNFDASELYEVIKNFHNTRSRVGDLLEAAHKDKCCRLKNANELVAFVTERDKYANTVIERLESGVIPLRVTHNDTKLNNVMIDDATHEGICVIDLDTVMRGSLLYDFGDSIRFGCNAAAEDEADLGKVKFRIDLFEEYVKGFLSEVKDFITEEESKLLAFSAILMTFECGIRFLTDYLQGDTYFKIRHENHNLDRARNQFRLVEDMESCLFEMQGIVGRYSH